MKYHQIITALTAEPLLVVPATAISLLALFRHHAAGQASPVVVDLSPDDVRAQREGTGQCGEKVDLEQMEIIEGIAHIPIGGPIGKGLGKFEKGAGAVDVDDLTDELDQAEEDPEVIGAILDIDSPGGMVSGIPEAADRIAAFPKPIYAFSSGLVASAAYWLAAATDGIFATKSANLGSIGVYIPWADLSEMYKKEGVKIELFTSGKYKGMGFPGTSLSKPQRELLADRVAQIAGDFYSHVKANRPDVEDDSMQGQTFLGPQALERGLLDQLVTSKDDVVSLLLG